MNTKIVVVAIVSVLVVAGIGAYLVYSSNDDSRYRSTDDTGRLMIMGNANNDDYLDEEDITALQSIIDGEMKKTPYADANNDGAIDQKDINMVKRMIDREKMKIYYTDGWGDVKTVNYPLNNVILCGTPDVFTAMRSINAMNKVAAYSDNSTSILDSVFYGDLMGLPIVGASITRVDIDKVAEVQKTRSIDAIITITIRSMVSNESDFNVAGIDVIRLAFGDSFQSIGATLTLGYLLNAEEMANKYAEFTDKVISEVEEKVKNITNRVTTLSVSMNNYVSGKENDDYRITGIAGAINVSEWESSRINNIGDEWIYEYPTDFIISRTTMGYDVVDINAVWANHSPYFKDTVAYKNGGYYLINASMPVAVRVATAAEIFYPEIFGEGYADKYHQQYIDEFVEMLKGNYDVTKRGAFVITKDMITN